ncbi:MAG: hypothetical protein ABFR62_02395 [Bacteroidota bacterium]
MSNIENLENQKKELIGQVTGLNREKENRKTVIYSLYGFLAVLITLLGYTYVFGPILGEYKTKVSNSEYLSSKLEKLNAENLDYKVKIENLNTLLEENANDNVLESDLVYRVQIGAFQKFKMGMYSPDLSGVLEKNDRGFNKYSLGVFNHYKEALKFEREVRKMGIRSAFMIAEYKGESINLKEAVKIEKS